MNILFTICGRAGSKGVKNKNIRMFLGKPLYMYTLRSIVLYMQQYANIKEHYDMIISTDSPDFLQKFSHNKDILCRERPVELSQDNTPKMPVILDALEYAQNITNTPYDYVIDLDITSPLRTVQDIRNAYEKKIKCAEAQVVYSVTHARRNPYFNMVKQNGAFFSRVLSTDFVSRQQAPVVYDMNASIYVYEASFLKSGAQSPLDGKGDIIIMKDTGVIDIDSEEDFIMMEWIASRMAQTEKGYQEIFCFDDHIV